MWNEHPSWRLANSEQARARREFRRAQWKMTGEGDPLAKRARLVAQWRRDALSRGDSRALADRFPACWALYRNPVFWRYLMPGLRAKLRELYRTERQGWLRKLREDAEAARQRKDEAAAAARRARDPQGNLF